MTDPKPNSHGAKHASAAPTGLSDSPLFAQPRFVSPGRDQTDPGSFQIELAYLLGSIATGVLIAVIYQALTGTLWGMAS